MSIKEDVFTINKRLLNEDKASASAILVNTISQVSETIPSSPDQRIAISSYLRNAETLLVLLQSINVKKPSILSVYTNELLNSANILDKFQQEAILSAIKNAEEE